ELQDANRWNLIRHAKEKIGSHASVRYLDTHGQFGHGGDCGEVVFHVLAIAVAVGRPKRLQAVRADFLRATSVLHGFEFVRTVHADQDLRSALGLFYDCGRKAHPLMEGKRTRFTRTRRPYDAVNPAATEEIGLFSQAILVDGKVFVERSLHDHEDS